MVCVRGCRFACPRVRACNRGKEVDVNNPLDTAMRLTCDLAGLGLCSVAAAVLAPYYAFHLLGWGVSGVMARVNSLGNSKSWRGRC